MDVNELRIAYGVSDWGSEDATLEENAKLCAALQAWLNTHVTELVEGVEEPVPIRWHIIDAGDRDPQSYGDLTDPAALPLDIQHDLEEGWDHALREVFGQLGRET